MKRAITIIGENGNPMPEGLWAELLRSGEVVAQSKIDANGTAVFDVDGPGPFHLRVSVPPEMSLSKVPVQP